MSRARAALLALTRIVAIVPIFLAAPAVAVVILVVAFATRDDVILVIALAALEGAGAVTIVVAVAFAFRASVGATAVVVGVDDRPESYVHASAVATREETIETIGMEDLKPSPGTT